MSKWIADHRLLTRIVLVAFDALWVALLVAGLFSGGNRWSDYLIVILYGWLTYSFGWAMPTSVDNWRKSGPPGGPGSSA